MPFMRKYNTLLVTGTTSIRIPIIKRGVVDFAVGADWTPAAGDVKVFVDAAAVANITNLPTAIASGNTAQWEFILTAAELSCKQVLVMIADAATKTIEDQAFIIETYGNASAMYAADLSLANLPANVTQLLGTAWLTPGVAGTPDVNAKLIGATAQTGGDLAARLPAALTANGNMKSSLMEILTTALTETAGQIAGAFKKFFNVAAPTGTVNSLADAVPGAAGGGFIAGTNAATSIVAAAGSALTLTGQGTGAGLSATGGATGAGVVMQAGATGPNHGLHCVGVGAGGDGILAQGASDATGAAAGLKAIGAGGGIGLWAEGADGIFTAGGSGGPGGHGINAISVLAGSGLHCVGSGVGSGIGATGGATDGHGMLLQGTAGGAGMQASAGATGQGITALGGATSGAGLYAVAATSGAGINAVGAGGSKDIDSSEIDAIKAATDNLPSAVKKNTARRIHFYMVLANTRTPATGLTVTAERALDGAVAFTGAAGAVTEVGAGWYFIDAVAGDLNGDTVAWKMTAASADPCNFSLLTEP